MYKLNIDECEGAILFRVEVGGIGPKGWHFLPKKKIHFPRPDLSHPGRINSTFLALFLLTLQFRVDGCLCVRRNRGCGENKHENMDSNHTCEQTRNNHWKQTSTQVSPSYLEYLGYLYLNVPETTLRPWWFYPDPVSVLTRYHKGFQRILTCGSYSSEEAGGSETLVSQKLKHNRRRRHNQNTTYVVEWLVELPIYIYIFIYLNINKKEIQIFKSYILYQKGVKWSTKIWGTCVNLWISLVMRTACFMHSGHQTTGIEYFKLKLGHKMNGLCTHCYRVWPAPTYTAY